MYAILLFNDSFKSYTIKSMNKYADLRDLIFCRMMVEPGYIHIVQLVEFAKGLRLLGNYCQKVTTKYAQLDPGHFHKIFDTLPGYRWVAVLEENAQVKIATEAGVLIMFELRFALVRFEYFSKVEIYCYKELVFSCAPSMCIATNFNWPHAHAVKGNSFLWLCCKVSCAAHKVHFMFVGYM